MHISFSIDGFSYARLSCCSTQSLLIYSTCEGRSLRWRLINYILNGRQLSSPPHAQRNYIYIYTYIGELIAVKPNNILVQEDLGYYKLDWVQKKSCVYCKHPEIYGTTFTHRSTRYFMFCSFNIPHQLSVLILY